MQDFISSQLLNDEQWQEALNNGFDDATAIKGSRAERLRPLIEEGMRMELAQVQDIADNPETPTFENTIKRLCKNGELLERASTIMYNLLSADTDDELDNLANEMASKLSAHSNLIMMNEKLFGRVKYVYEHAADNLPEEDKMLLDKTYEMFERSGATLDEEGKKLYKEISARLSELSLKFSQNLLKETNSFILHITSETELSGLPEMHQKTAVREAEERGLKGWVFTLHAPSYGPFMMYADNRARREELYRAYHTRCTHDNENNNFAVVTDIVNLRRELAQLLGYNTYADYALKRRMAQTPAAVYNLLDDLITNYLPQAKEEVALVERKAKELEGKDFKLQPWDFAYYSQKLKKELYDYDPDMLRPYFELSQVIQGVLGLATKLYGISFVEAPNIPVYQEDVKAFKVFDKDNSFLAVLFLDFFPRTSKQGGAWMTDYRGEHADVPSTVKVTTNNSVRPVVSVTTNFTKPTDDTPALLTLGEVETFLHEFGHALHGIFAMTHYASLSGTSVYWDFVELPSQFMENYAVEPDFLNTFARHYQTGKSLPEEFVQRIKNSRNFQAAYACIRQVSFGLLDMAYYMQTDRFDEDIRLFEQKAWRKVALLPVVPETCMSVQFGHIMSGGYSAGYYSYKWAEVLDADAFAHFKENGIFNSEIADSFRQNVLSRGGTEPPMTLYTRFRGNAPSIDALLKRDGIVKA